MWEILIALLLFVLWWFWWPLVKIRFWVWVDEQRKKD